MQRLNITGAICLCVFLAVGLYITFRDTNPPGCAGRVGYISVRR